MSDLIREVNQALRAALTSVGLRMEGDVVDNGGKIAFTVRDRRSDTLTQGDGCIVTIVLTQSRPADNDGASQGSHYLPWDGHGVSGDSMF